MALPPSSLVTTNTVEIGKCMEELVKFTLESHVNRTLELDLGLSTDFCSSLLKDVPLSDDNKDGKCPLYKHLASALLERITHAGSCQGFGNIMTLDEKNDLNSRENWNQLVVKEGSEIVKLLRTTDFELHVQEPFFTQIRDGLKTVEGRCASGDYNSIGCGALILFNKCLVYEVQVEAVSFKFNTSFATGTVLNKLLLQDVRRYVSFYEMLRAESLTKILPSIKTIDEGVQVYRRFYTEEKEKDNGVLAISIVKLTAQPYIYLAKILSGLSYEDLQSLLDLIHPVTTI